MSILRPWRNVETTQINSDNDDDVDERMPPTRAAGKSLENLIFLAHRRRRLLKEREATIENARKVYEQMQSEVFHIDEKIRDLDVQAAEAGNQFALFVNTHLTIVRCECLADHAPDTVRARRDVVDIHVAETERPEVRTMPPPAEPAEPIEIETSARLAGFETAHQWGDPQR